MLANNSWFRLLGRFQNDFREISLGNLEKRVRKRVPLTQKSYATTFKNARKPSIFKDFEGSTRGTNLASTCTSHGLALQFAFS